MRQLSKRFVAQTSSWEEAVHACSTTVRELGDFQNYLSVLEREVGELAQALESVAEKKAHAAARQKRPSE